MKERSTWDGLTRAQLHELDDAVQLPNRRRMKPSDAYKDYANELAHRTVHLLMANDLRGAINAAELATAATNMALRYDENRARLRDRLEAIQDAAERDPRGRLVYVEGQKKRKRVFPADGVSR